MSNWSYYQLDVLASSTAEINQIAERLNQPSSELVNWIAERDGQQANEVIEGLKGLLEFKAVRNLGYVSDDVNKARRFSLAFKSRFYGSSTATWSKFRRLFRKPSSSSNTSICRRATQASE